ncbi:hypothetical protein [Nostoc sp. PA-18-2419]|uniref:hypothetical protein n=1 Tax=Nostoc sp. PA-18-2419 TaxID=2575443 RepID=UPI001CB8DB8B|nr:hypothetical protein [Nostoc sp. PA-18-2419]
MTLISLNKPQELVLTKLGEGLPVITSSFGAALAEACAVCLQEQGHLQGVELTVNGDFNTIFSLYWQPVTQQMLRCWNDKEFTTEQAAYGIAFMLVRQLTELTVIERSRKGTGFDYWLGSEDIAGELLFQNKVRLEVSGIRKADDRRVRARVKQKIDQTNPSDGTFPA